MKKSLVLLFLSLGFAGNAQFSQGFVQFPKPSQTKGMPNSQSTSLNTTYSGSETSIVPLAPNASSLGKFGEITNNPNSGQISPTIPIFEIKLNDFTYPIALNYSSNGLKMNETASWVGTGWSLNAMGVINRQLRGIPDELTYGYNGSYATGNICQLWTTNFDQEALIPNWRTESTPNVRYRDFLLGIYQNRYDSEPDMFHASSASFSAKFGFENTQITGVFPRNTIQSKKATTLPLSDDKIEGEFNPLGVNKYSATNTIGTIDKFKITTKEGVIYTFDYKDGSINPDPDVIPTTNQSKYNSWYLTSIETPNGNSLIFSYKYRQIVMPAIFSQNAEIAAFYKPGFRIENAIRGLVVTQPKVIDIYLDKILINNGEQGSVEFIEQTTDRADWDFETTEVTPSKPKALDKIVVKNGQGEIIKDFQFSYVPNVERLLLRSVVERNGIKSHAPYQFFYADENMIPAYYDYNDTNFNEDYWGFYNNCSSGCGQMIPTFNAIFSVDPNGGNTQFEITGNNKQPNEEKTKVGQLMKIVYPTGGTSEFTYELNKMKYMNEFPVTCPDPYPIQLVPLRIEGKDYDASLGMVRKRLEYRIPPGMDTRTLCFKINYNASLGKTGSATNPVTAVIDITNENNAILYTKILSTNPPSAPVLSASGVDLARFPAGKSFGYTRIYIDLYVYAESASDFPSSNFVEVQLAMQNAAQPQWNEITAGGLRIARVKTCPVNDSNNNSNCTFKDYFYTYNDNKTSGNAMSPLFLDYNTYKIVFKPVFLGTETHVVPFRGISSSTQLPIVNSGGNSVYYDQVKIVNGGFNSSGVMSTEGYTINKFVPYLQESDTFIKTFNRFALYSPAISNEWNRGKIREIITYHQNNAILARSNNSYIKKDSSDQKFGGIKVAPLVQIPEFEEIQVYTFINYWSKNNFNYNNLQESTTYFYDNSYSLTSRKEVVEKSEYFYNSSDVSGINRYFPSEVQKTESNGKLSKTIFKYPFEMHITEPSDFQSSVALLRNKHMLSKPVKVQNYVNSELINTQISVFNNSFGNTNKVFLKYTKQYFGNTDALAKIINFNSYDEIGNIREMESDGQKTAYVWSYGNAYPIIEAKNTGIVQIGSIAGINLTTLGFNKVTSQIESSIQTIRNGLPTTSLVTSYNYRLGYGVSSTTTANNIKTFYNYDDLGRLSTIEMFENGVLKTLKKYDYKYSSGQ
jgi:hypothetical protein